MHGVVVVLCIVYCTLLDCVLQGEVGKMKDSVVNSSRMLGWFKQKKLVSVRVVRSRDCTILHLFFGGR